MTTDQLTNDDDDLNNKESEILQKFFEIETLSPFDSVTKQVSSSEINVDDNEVHANDDIANKDEIVNQKLNKKEATQKSIKLKTKCPLCESTFKVAFGVRRHLMNKHDVKKNELKEFKIDCTKKRCPFCREYFGNLPKHRKVCKIKTVKKKTKARIALTHPDHTSDVCVSGGRLLRARWDEWIPTQNLSELTVNHYTRKLSVLFKFFEKNIPNFLLDNLIVPLENKTQFPLTEQLPGEGYNYRRQDHSNKNIQIFCPLSSPLVFQALWSRFRIFSRYD